MTPSLQIRRVAFSIVFMCGLSAVAPAFSTTADEALILADMTRGTTQRIAVQQAAMALMSETTDIDGDGYIESASILTGAGPIGGGVVPLSSSAPKTDSYGTLLGYCSWDNGSINASSGRITGAVNGYTAPALAVITSGIDNIFQTSCANIAAGTGAKGDDFVISYNSTQLQMGSGGTLFVGDPVADLAALNALDPAVLKNGQTRLNMSTNVLYRWNSTTSTWEAVTSMPWTPVGAGYVSNSKIGVIGGSSVGLANGAYYSRIGAEIGNNLIFDATSIQARSNGAAATLNLNPLGGNVIVGGNLYSKDITASRGDGTGVLYLNDAHNKYLHFDGAKYQMPGADLYINGSKAWSQGNLTNLDQLTNGPGYVNTAQAKAAAPVQSIFGRTGNVIMNSLDVAGALGYTPVNRAGDTMTGLLVAAPTTGGIAQATGGLGRLEVRGSGGANAAYMTFHRPGVYASYFGLDTDNVWKVGGYSAGAVAHTIWHSGNSASIPLTSGQITSGLGYTPVNRAGDTMTGDLVTTRLRANASGSIGGAASTSYDIGAGRIAAGQSIYSYGKICVGNSSGDCSGTGGAVITSSTMTIAGSNVLTAANIKANVNGSMITSVRGDQNTDIGVAQMMRWKNYGNGHVIFDASQSKAPEGQTVNNTNAQNAWTGSYPTLMGWSGASTYGVRVDSARLADTATTATNLATARTLAMTGDGSWAVSFNGSSNVSSAMTLSNTGVGAGSYGSATVVPSFTVDAKGRLTAASNVTITPAWGSVTSKPTTIAGYGITDVNNYAPTKTGTGASGTWGINVTGNAATATTATTLTSGATINDVYNNGWYRSTGDVGWYSQTYGGGIYMTDTAWVRAYNGKGILTTGLLYAGTGLQIAGTTVIDQFRNVNAAAIDASNYVRPGVIASNGAACPAAGSIGRDGSGNVFVCN